MLDLGRLLYGCARTDAQRACSRQTTGCKGRLLRLTGGGSRDAAAAGLHIAA